MILWRQYYGLSNKTNVNGERRVKNCLTPYMDGPMRIKNRRMLWMKYFRRSLWMFPWIVLFCFSNFVFLLFNGFIYRPSKRHFLREKSQAIKMSDPQLKKLKIQTGKNLLTKLILIKFSMKLPTPGYFPIYRFQLNIVLFCLFFWHKSWNHLSTYSRVGICSLACSG